MDRNSDMLLKEHEVINSEICSHSKTKPMDRSDKKTNISESGIRDDLSIPNQYGYHSNNLTDFGGDFTEEFSVRYEGSEKLPDSFKVLTWNIWGMNKHNNSGPKYVLLSELMMLRMEKIVKTIKHEDPDIVVFQEMGYESLGLLRGFMRRYGLSSLYRGYGENFTRYTPDSMERNIGRDLEIYVFSKYVPESITQFSLSGNLGYTTGVVFVSFKDVCVVGCYLQAGSKNSPGQEKVWFHYARCRHEQLTAIGQMIESVCPKSTVILCGDFNMHLDGDNDEWPETKGILELNMQDTWRVFHPNKTTQPGFTEDTSINHMRWNMKFMEKHYRYDGIFLKSSVKTLKIVNSQIIGLKGYQMDDIMFREFVKVMSNKSSTGDLRSQTYHPSDHFGVVTTFSI